MVRELLLDGEHDHSKLESEHLETLYSFDMAVTSRHGVLFKNSFIVSLQNQCVVDSLKKPHDSWCLWGKMRGANETLFS